MEENKKYKLKGVNDDHNICEVCGKTNLKKVMWLAELNQDGEEIADPFAAGTTCGGKLLGIKARGKNRILSQVHTMAKNQVDAKIRETRDGWRVYKNMLCPPEFWIDFALDKITVSELVKLRDEAYPILKILNGRITLEEAIKYC